MTVFLIVYGVIALAVFIAAEVFCNLDVAEKNSMFKIPVYEVNHIKCLITGAFFPIVFLIILIGTIVQYFLERRK